MQKVRFMRIWSSVVLPSLQSILLGDGAFHDSLTTVFDGTRLWWVLTFLDLPSLTVINLGFTALEGEYATSCSLVMQGIPSDMDVILIRSS